MKRCKMNQLAPAVQMCPRRRVRWFGWEKAAYAHVWLLLYWPLFGVLFYAAERLYQPACYYVMYTPLDDLIPFCEWFLLPYLFWFVYLVGIHIYTLFFDAAAFRKLMKFILVTYSAALVFFLLFPNCQLLRPTVFPRNNGLTRFVAAFYQFDTNTNVCPSLHVVGSLAVHFAAQETNLYRKRGWRIFFRLMTPLICVSTVFLKQHSALDLLAGLGISLLAYGFAFKERKIMDSQQIQHRRTRRN